MKKLIILIVIAAAGWFGWKHYSKNGEEAPKSFYTKLTVQRGDVRVKVEAVGVAQPQNRIELASPVAGRLEDVLVQEGDEVKKGDVLAWISSTDRATLLDAARARSAEELARWEDLYKATPLIAPVDGQIISRKLEPGQSVAPDKPVLVISDRLIILATVDETDISQIRENQKAEVILDSYPDNPLAAKVAHVAYEATSEENVTTYDVDILPNRIPDFLRSGMTASVTFFGAETNAVLVVPTEAVKGDRVKRYVLVPGKTEAQPPIEKPIVTGLEDGKQVEVREGFEEGATILVEDVAAAMAAEGRKATNPLNPFGRMSRRR